MFERSTDRARRVVVLAHEEARRLGHGEIDIGHLVLGALIITDVARGTEDHGDVPGLRQLIESSLGEGTAERSPGSAGHIPVTPATKATL